MKQMKKTLRVLLVIAGFALIFTSCKKDPVEEQNDNEVITTVQLNFTPVGGGAALTYKWEDLDGDGGANPIIDVVTLAPATTYNVQLTLLDKTKTPPVITSDEVLSEAIDHRFYFEPTGVNITVSNLSNDPNGIPVGLTSTWTTGAASTGAIKITLRHYENGGKASADLVSDAKSSTDVEASFNATVQ